MKNEINNKENIIKAGIKLFSERGYDGIGVQEIVEQVNVTKPTLYHYFGSKRGLLDEILKLYGDVFYQVVKEKAIYANDITKNLNELAFTFIDFAKNNKEFYRMHLAMHFSPPDSEANQAVSVMNEKIYRSIEELFKNAEVDHGNMRGRSKIYAVTFIGMINSYISLSLNGYIELYDQLIYKAVHQFMHGIFS